MQTFELLDRFELLYPTKSKLSDLRRSYIDKDLSSIFRLLPKTINGDTEELRKVVLEHNLHSIFRLANDEDLRKLILEDNTWKLWPVLSRYTDTQFISAFKNFFVNDTRIDTDCFSRGQLQSKLWLVDKLKKCNVDLGTVFLCAGWYATLATMIFESDIKVDKIRSFDINDTCVAIAETFNKPWVMDDWKFKATTQDILDIDYNNFCYKSIRSNGSKCDLVDTVDTIINTSCEHILDFANWYDKIPKGKLVVLQSNDFIDVDEHVNCVKDSLHFEQMAPLSKVLFTGELNIEKYTRYMRIGIR